MPVFGVVAAVLHEGRVLLTKREDLPVWCLPGGGIEAGESLAQTAVREVREETGLVVEPLHLVGVYSRPRWRGGGHEILFAARPVGGELLSTTPETVAGEYFDPDGLPDTLLWWHRRQIADAIAGVKGTAWSLDATWPAGEVSREEGRRLIESGKVDPEKLIRHFCVHPGPESEHCDVGESK